jgi:hypothetical protein
MGTGTWLAAFRSLDERVKQPDATPAERAQHLVLREEVSRWLTQAQNLAVPGEHQARKAFRVAHPFGLELDGVYRAVTHDISHSGLSALVPAHYREAQLVSVTITLGRGLAPVSGRGRVVSAVPDANSVCSRISLALLDLDAAGEERLKAAIFDVALLRIV